MDPISLMLGAMVIAGGLMTVPKALADASAVRRASKAGAWDYLRDREKYRTARAEAWAARRKALAHRSGVFLPDSPADATPGFKAYAAHHYRAFWAKKLAQAQAKQANPVGPKPAGEGLSAKATRLADRADAAIIDKGKRVIGSKPVQAIIRPVGEKRRDRPEQPEAPAVTSEPEPEPTSAPQDGSQPTPEPDPAPTPTPENTDPNTNTGGPEVTTPIDTGAPTGEAVNYETHMVELDAQEQQFQMLLDSSDAATRAAAELKARADEMQQRTRAIHAAAQTKLEHLAARGMDADTLTHAAAAVEAVDPNTINALYEQVEVLEQQAADTRNKAEAGLASVAGERATITAKYGDAHVTVASELGGDSSYLNSSGVAQPDRQQPVNA